MILHSMTATFGKLENETLTLQPGLNVITAPNEWGKSTWCAFLAAMLYGLDTRAKSTKTNLADKERYQPWSGSPMSGRLELTWQGRSITVERTTQGRIPLGKFRAWETESGLEVPELTGQNCGEKLLGVERSVFTRTALIRFREMNITEDEALRRRLNNLVTTGEDNPDMDRLAGEIKALRNKIRYHKSGLLPTAQQEAQRLEETLRQRKLLETQLSSVRGQLDALEDWQAALENHQRHLAWEEACTSREKLNQARKACDEAEKTCEIFQERCRNLPSDRQTQDARNRLEQLLSRREELREELEGRTAPEEPGVLPEQFAGLTGEEALDRAREDGKTLIMLRKNRWYLLLPGILGLIGGAALAMMGSDYGIPGAVAGVVILLACGITLMMRRRKAGKLVHFYGSEDPADWEALARCYGRELYLHSAQAAVDREEQRRSRMRLAALEESLNKLTSGREPEEFRRRLDKILQYRAELEEAERRRAEALRHLQTISGLIREVPEPEIPDKLDLSFAETETQLQECAVRKSTLSQQLGQLRGRLESMGSRETLEEQLEQWHSRIESLEKTGLALTLAQETLTEAAEELQRRFAPQIAAGARQRMELLTDGRYDRLSLQRDFTVMAGTGQENVMRSSLWRSDGTADQLYLSLRLAVAETLIPEAPLILDDALVRFDDLRLERTMALLKTEGQKRQVIVFSCHGREAEYV